MTIILAMMFGGTVGFSVAIGFNYNSYNRGKKDGLLEGRDLGHEIGYKEGYAHVNHEAEAYRRIKEKANVVSFRKNGESL